MKVGILTFHSAHNYGAVLQAFALKQKLTDMNHSVQIINYRNKVIKKKYSSKLSIQLRPQDIIHPKGYLHKLQFIYNIPRYQPAWKKQCERFEDFIEKVLLEGEIKEYTFEELQTVDKEVLIAGSDQIWTGDLTGNLDQVYLLDFPTKAKKISYAASIYGGKIPKTELATFKRCLSEFDKISVREEKLAESISRDCGYSVVTVLDPTLLLDADKYVPLIGSERLCEDKFLLAYFVTDSSALANLAAYIAKSLKLQLIEIHYYKKEPDNTYYIADAGPSEFLWYISNATYIITNSFHGTVFSILFHKNFYSIYNNDARMDNLLNQLGLSSRHMTENIEGIHIENVEYKNVDERLKEFRKISEEFLIDALREIGDK